MAMFQKAKYSPLTGEDHEYSREPPKRKQKQKCIPSLQVMIRLLGFAALTTPIYYVASLHAYRSKTCGLPSDVLFGNIPWQPTVLENDQRFIDSDPFVWGPNHTSVWNDHYPGTWIAVDDLSVGDAQGRGMRMVDVAAEPTSWAPTSEGFGVAAMHQLHCVMTIKHALLEFEKGNIPAGNKEHEHGHLHHCVETLRQAVMCHGDLTLEQPHDSGDTQNVSGWGNVHMCRPWQSIVKAVLEKRIVRSPHGWISDARAGM